MVQLRRAERVINMSLGNQELFAFMNNIAPYESQPTKWQADKTIFIEPSNYIWRVLDAQNPTTYIKLTKSSGKVSLSAKFDS